MERPSKPDDHSGMSPADDMSAQRILVVDDDESIRRLVDRIFHEAGFQDVHGASTAVEARELVADRCPDLVVLDLHMPGGGLRLLDELRALSARRRPAILVLTGDPEARRGALARGAHDFLAKPFEAGELVSRGRDLLRRRGLGLDGPRAA
jgi:DNA-binding response OmpR family regulator